MSRIRSRGWCFTINNPTDDDQEVLIRLKDDARYMIVGSEVGADGTPHFQGYVFFPSQRTFSSLKKKLPRAHIEKARGNPAQNRQYCSKDGNLLFEHGQCPTKGQKTVARAARNQELMSTPLNKLVDEGVIALSQAPLIARAKHLVEQSKLECAQVEACRGIWIYGEPGVGKSHAVYNASQDVYIKQQNKWWDGYIGQRVVLLDDFDCKMLGHHLKIWSDKWSVVGEIKGGRVKLAYRWFVITSNYLPENIWTEDDMLCRAISRRFQFIHMTSSNRDLQQEEIAKILNSFS